ncbi:MAG TPA: bifunctional folylpolyglutamate synthase/dihydrofolate synthase [Flavobacteriales bacterium]|nr:bifunctional folylpolyglutamate synthase/dihydrofolate synthase [Flavobacteriales bacterium]
MTYQQTLDYLFNRLPMYQRLGAAAYKADIGNIVLASQHLDNPHKKFKSIHVAGTNGKGSTSHLLASIFQESGYKVGLYTSPHLKDFRERIKINGQMIPETEVISFVSNNKAFFETLELSFFEFTVALAFDYFAKQKVDIAIIETGLGGRLDSTNIIRPELAIITNISLDHANLLGGTIEKIAKEKAGIIKKNTPIIIGRKQKETTEIFRKIAEEKQTKLIYASVNNKYKKDLKKNYQKENISTTLTAITQLQAMNWNISEDNIINGIGNTQKNTAFMGRWQTLSKHPLIICDMGHNEDGIKQVIQQIAELHFNKLHFVFGVVKDKNIDAILSLMPKQAQYYFCQANIDRAMEVEELAKKAIKSGLKGAAHTSVKQALKNAKKNATKDDFIFVGGSAFVVAEVL